MRGPADAYPFRTLPAAHRFGIAIGLVAIVFLVNQSAGGLIDDGSHLVLLCTAVGATAWFAGTGPALLATVLGAVLGGIRDDQELSGAVPLHLALLLIHSLLLTAVVSELRSARRSAEERAREADGARRESEAANRMKDEFLATISHELRTPLNAVLGWVHLLRTGNLDSSTASKGFEAIDRNVHLQAQLTGDLLDMSKALTGKLRLDSCPSILADAVRQGVNAAMPAAKAKGVQLSVVNTSSAVVHGDPTRLRQIAWQLIANAIKFTPRGGRIEVSTEATQDEALLIVQDTGQGIDPAFLPRVFERFTQADSSATRNAGGLGVGLALVRELVELHGGEIDARNRPDVTGALFTVRLPLQVAESGQWAPQTGIAVEPLPSTMPPLDGLRVLVFEEDAEGRELLRTLLQHRGALVQTAGTVADALTSLEAWRPDVLVSDSLSAEHDSYSLIGKVRSLEAHRGGRIPAAALTTAARTDERLRHLLADVQREVPKPIEPGTLTAEIARLTGRERRRAER
jgi:signal transduction histidine kinase/CheY-like chemotaxis protein